MTSRASVGLSVVIGAVVGAIVFIVVVELMPDVSVEVSNSTDNLSRDAAYTGSLTLAGLAVFGSALMSRVGSVTKHDTRDRRFGATMSTMAPLALAGTHMMFAALMCCNDPSPLLVGLAAITVLFLALSVLGYVFIITSPRQDGDVE